MDILQIIAKDRKSGILLVEWADITVAYYVKVVFKGISLPAYINRDYFRARYR